MFIEIVLFLAGLAAMVFYALSWPYSKITGTVIHFATAWVLAVAAYTIILFSGWDVNLPPYTTGLIAAFGNFLFSVSLFHGTLGAISLETRFHLVAQLKAVFR